MIFEDLIKGLGERLSIELEIEDDTCMIGVDDMVITVMNLPEAGSVALVGDIGEPPPQGLERLYRSMLVANHLFAGTGGSTISFNDESGKFTLCRIDSASIVDAESFFTILERFVNTLETWRKMLADYRPMEDGDAGSGPSGDIEADRLGASFMSV